MNTLQHASQLAITIGPLDVPPQAAMDETARCGLFHIQWSANHAGMRPRDLDSSARRGVVAALNRRGLRLAGIDLWIPTAHFEHIEQSSRAIDAVLAAVALAEDFGRVPLSTALPTGEAVQYIRELIAAESQRRGIVIADHTIEAHSQPQSEVDLGIDPAALIAAGHDPADVVIKSGSRCKSVRLSDLLTSGTRGPIGQSDGQLDVEAYHAAVAAVEYDRPILIDTRQWPDQWQGIEQTIEAWQKAAPVF